MSAIRPSMIALVSTSVSPSEGPDPGTEVVTVGGQELLGDARFDTLAARHANSPALVEILDRDRLERAEAGA